MPKKPNRKVLRQLAADIKHDPWHPAKPKTDLRTRVRLHVQRNFQSSFQRLATALDAAAEYSEKVVLYSSEIHPLANVDRAKQLIDAISDFRSRVDLSEYSGGEESPEVDERIAAKLNVLLGLEDVPNGAPTGQVSVKPGTPSKPRSRRPRRQ